MKHQREDYNRIQDPFGKIPENEPVFLLRGDDSCTPIAIAAWLEEAKKRGVDLSVINQVEQHLGHIVCYQSVNGSHLPHPVQDVREFNRAANSTPKLVNDLAHVLNRHCVDKQTNTPDHVLAEFVVRVLNAFTSTSSHRANQEKAVRQEPFGGCSANVVHHD